MTAYVRADGATIVAYPYSFALLRADHPNVSFPREPTPELLAEYGVFPVAASTPPAEEGKRPEETTPVFLKGEWVQGWVMVNLPRRQIPKWLVVSRLTDQQLEDAFAIMTLRQVERWRSSAFPDIYVDDPDMLAILSVVGADPTAVLSEVE